MPVVDTSWRAGLATLAVLGAAACAATEPGPPPPLAAVIEVIDGDTIVVRSGHRTETVRLIGIDTPEVAHHGSPAECFGPEAGARLEQVLSPGTVVELTVDAEARDVYDRLLAYVATSTVPDVAHLMAAEGYARELAISPNLATADRIAAAVAEARLARIGLWGACDDDA